MDQCPHIKGGTTRVLVLGCEGMLGHKIYQVFSKKFETFATTKGNPENLRVYNIFDESKLIGDIDVHNF